MNHPAPVFGAAAAGALRFACGGEFAEARPSGALVLPAHGALVVADLHLGRSERLARRGGALLPPYETEATLDRLAAEISTIDPAHVVLLGDSFDDDACADALPERAREALAAMAAGRRWTWIAGNHDPGPLGLPGEHRASLRLGALTLRHEPTAGAAAGEVCGHLHPKATVVLRGRRVTRRCVVEDGARAILPAFGAYTGGLRVSDPVLRGLMGPESRALLLGPRVVACPLHACA